MTHKWGCRFLFEILSGCFFFLFEVLLMIQPVRCWLFQNGFMLLFQEGWTSELASLADLKRLLGQKPNWHASSHRQFQVLHDSSSLGFNRLKTGGNGSDVSIRLETTEWFCHFTHSIGHRIPFVPLMRRNWIRVWLNYFQPRPRALHIIVGWKLSPVVFYR